MLADMRSVKMMGLSAVLSNMVQTQRIQETNRMASARWSIVWQNVVQNLPYTLAPSLTFVIYVAQATGRGQSSIDVPQAFTSLAIISLLTGPVGRLLSAIPSTAASLGSFDRIQTFLTTSPRADPRLIAASGTAPSTIGSQNPIAICAEALCLRPAPTAETIMANVNFDLPCGSLTMVIGPVGSGKTTLLKAILGEVASEDGGSMRVESTEMALCVQVPWLLNTTIRQAISGYLEDDLNVDEAWYRRCLHACALDLDLDRLPNGDGTMVGSANTVLSGGQRARVALARAVYARADILLLDDVLGALDTSTQVTIVSRLFGETGLLRKHKVTTVLVTHAS
jgi:ATP-binding cassette subfamily C (CFTR/MRP) protein 1